MIYIKLYIFIYMLLYIYIYKIMYIYIYVYIYNVYNIYRIYVYIIHISQKKCAYVVIEVFKILKILPKIYQMNQSLNRNKSICQSSDFIQNFAKIYNLHQIKLVTKTHFLQLSWVILMPNLQIFIFTIKQHTKAIKSML